MDFILKPHNRNVPDDVLLADIRRAAAELNVPSVTMDRYATVGRFGAETIRKRFGSWNRALDLAGLEVQKRWQIPDELLFQNLEAIWRRLGRQPRRDELDQMKTSVSKSVYTYRFGSWRKALEAFVEWVNQDEAEGIPEQSCRPLGRRTPRQPSLRLRFRVMRRDAFRCCHCGRSPPNDPTIELHVDHKVPWANGGETIYENLQTLCFDCNIGKSDLPENNA
jgi:5-methylcytosine-specific restriction endonuclease McrA